eukprot:gene22329-28449_t
MTADMQNTDENEYTNGDHLKHAVVFSILSHLLDSGYHSFAVEDQVNGVVARRFGQDSGNLLQVFAIRNCVVNVEGEGILTIETFCYKMLPVTPPPPHLSEPTASGGSKKRKALTVVTPRCSDDEAGIEEEEDGQTISKVAVFLPTGEAVEILRFTPYTPQSDSSVFLTPLDALNRTRGYSLYLPTSFTSFVEYWELAHGIKVVQRGGGDTSYLVHIRGDESCGERIVPLEALCRGTAELPPRSKRHAQEMIRSLHATLTNSAEGDAVSSAVRGLRVVQAPVLTSSLTLRNTSREGANHSGASGADNVNTKFRFATARQLLSEDSSSAGDGSVRKTATPTFTTGRNNAVTLLAAVSSRPFIITGNNAKPNAAPSVMSSFNTTAKPPATTTTAATLTNSVRKSFVVPSAAAAHSSGGASSVVPSAPIRAFTPQITTKTPASESSVAARAPNTTSKESKKPPAVVPIVAGTAKAAPQTKHQQANPVTSTPLVAAKKPPPSQKKSDSAKQTATPAVSTPAVKLSAAKKTPAPSVPTKPFVPATVKTQKPTAAAKTSVVVSGGVSSSFSDSEDEDEKESGCDKKNDTTSITAIRSQDSDDLFFGGGGGRGSEDEMVADAKPATAVVTTNKPAVAKKTVSASTGTKSTPKPKQPSKQTPQKTGVARDDSSSGGFSSSSDEEEKEEEEEVEEVKKKKCNEVVKKVVYVKGNEVKVTSSVMSGGVAKGGSKVAKKK